MRRILLFAIATAALAGCGTGPRVVPAAPPPPPPAVASFGGYGDLAVPPRLADGSYVTPNRSVSAAGAVWHLRAGLNVAALSCRGPEEAALIAGYNALLQRQRSGFDAAYKTLTREHGNAASFDAAMTRLYNYYALPPAQPGLCAAAQAVLADAALLPTGGIDGFAPSGLARLEQVYTKIFAEQDAWLASRNAGPAPGALIAAAAPATPAPAPKPRQASPRIAVDPAVLKIP